MRWEKNRQEVEEGEGEDKQQFLNKYLYSARSIKVNIKGEYLKGWYSIEAIQKEQCFRCFRNFGMLFYDLLITLT